MIELSVVLISKNQAWNIDRLVTSVLKETEHFPGREIVLVDSASSDQTTEIAARYPISVLKLHPEQRLTAAAGRYVGYHHTTGDLVLFLDGDMELCSGWLEQALRSGSIAMLQWYGIVIDRPISLQTPVKQLLFLCGNYGEVFKSGMVGVRQCIAVLFWTRWARLTLIFTPMKNPNCACVSGMQATGCFVCRIRLHIIILPH